MTCQLAHNFSTRIYTYIELNHPIDFGNIETSCGDVGADERAALSIDKLEKAVGTCLLLELAV